KWVWPNYYVGQTYDDEITYFKNWIKDRCGWMDAELRTIIKVDETEPQVPTSFELFQNYPNPFNPETVISWQLAVGSYVTLKVFDVLGNEVATLADQFMKAGIYRQEFNVKMGHAPSLPSGVYFYQLRSSFGGGNLVETKKMILLR
ncbi:MAG: T9SS type A sorting domain-containing protein, partial [Ignavibacteria bacterium]|nr:T9SS type A sorting domain-containing protein [Ignavibacteria bacterium]